MAKKDIQATMQAKDMTLETNHQRIVKILVKKLVIST